MTESSVNVFVPSSESLSESANVIFAEDAMPPAAALSSSVSCVPAPAAIVPANAFAAFPPSAMFEPAVTVAVVPEAPVIPPSKRNTLPLFAVNVADVPASATLPVRRVVFCAERISAPFARENAFP